MRARAFPAVVAALAAAVAGCGGDGGGERDREGSGAPAARAAEATPGATATATPAPIPSVPVPARRAAARLPVEQLAGQVLLVGFEGTDLQADVFPELRGHGWGGVVVAPENAATADGVAALAGEARVVAEDARRPAPLVVAPGLTVQPRGSSPEAVRQATRATAEAARAAGVTLALEPPADIADATGPAAETGLSDDPAEAAALSAAAVDGWLAGGIAPAPAHFPGQGAAAQDPIEGPASVGLNAKDLGARDLVVFRAALARAPAVVVSSALFAGYDAVTPAAHAPAVVRDLLRRRLRFAGAAISDDLATLSAATGGTPPAAAVAALKAGVDLVQVPDASARGPVYDAVLRAVRTGDLPPSRLRDAAARVLALKAAVRARGARPAPSPG